MDARSFVRWVRVVTENGIADPRIRHHESQSHVSIRHLSIAAPMKRFFDIILSGLLVFLLPPVFALIALGIKFDSKGPIIYLQERVGRDGSYFFIYKFRTMVVDADKIGSYSTLPEDHRITRFGRMLRKTSLDELPQLFNVLKGDMSLVGPRPDVPRQRGGYTAKEWETRHKVRPGITGLAQANLRSYATPTERKQLDLDYVRRASFMLDLKILASTLNQVIRKGGY